MKADTVLRRSWDTQGAGREQDTGMDLSCQDFKDDCQHHAFSNKVTPLNSSEIVCHPG